MADWYKNIEPGIRDMVRLLRDNGFNTTTSCEHRMEITFDLWPGENIEGNATLCGMDELLSRNTGHDYDIILRLERRDSHLRSAGVVRFGNDTERRKIANKYRLLVDWWWPKDQKAG
jgi:hypothetical protein